MMMMMMMMFTRGSTLTTETNIPVRNHSLTGGALCLVAARIFRRMPTNSDIKQD